MTFEVSCGFIVYRENDGEREYLIIQSRNGDYGFPKGHMEDGESEIETAVRELKEETNLKVEATDGFRAAVEYKLRGKQRVMKRAVYFLGRCTLDGDLVCQPSEVASAEFLPLEKAYRMLSFENTKQLLLDADGFLHSKTHIR